MTTPTTKVAIFLKQPGNGVCIETNDEDAAQKFLDSSEGDIITVVRTRDGARVHIPVDNIADLIEGGY